MDKTYEAYEILCAVTGQAARGALGAGLSPEEVAAELESLADAIRDPGSVGAVGERVDDLDHERRARQVEPLHHVRLDER